MSEANSSFFERMAGHSVRGAGLLFVSGSLLRLTIRDRIAPLSAIYYATPVVILSGLAFFLMLAALRKKSWKSAGAMFALAAVWACVAWFTEIETPDRPGTAASTGESRQSNESQREASNHSDHSDQTVLLWNMRNGASGWDGAFDRFVTARPDIAGLVESYHEGQPKQLSRDLPSEYQTSPSWRGLMIVARGTIDDVDQGPLAHYGVYHAARVNVDGQAYRVVVVDLKSYPVVSRRPSLLALQKVIEKYNDEPLLVMGDFNTPYDSVHFELLSRDLTHAFRTLGKGYAATWPLPLPLLELDHIWFNDKVEGATCSRISSEFSDHQAVEFSCRAK